MLLVATIGEGRTLRSVAEACQGPFPSKNAKYDAEKYIGRRWRDALTSLAEFDGVRAPAPTRAYIRVHVRERSTGRPETWEAHVPLHFGNVG